MSGPMDPERLANTREWLGGGAELLHQPNASMLLADRDHWEAEAVRWAAATVRAQNETSDTRERLEAEVERLTADIILRDDVAEYYRDRCPVTAEDVDEAGVTQAKCEAWLAADGWSLASHPSNKSRTWQKEGAPDPVTLAPNSPTWPTCLSERIAVTIMLRAFDLGRPAQRILDEMAALEPKT